MDEVIRRHDIMRTLIRSGKSFAVVDVDKDERDVLSNGLEKRVSGRGEFVVTSSNKSGAVDGAE